MKQTVVAEFGVVLIAPAAAIKDWSGSDVPDDRIVTIDDAPDWIEPAFSDARIKTMLLAAGLVLALAFSIPTAQAQSKRRIRAAPAAIVFSIDRSGSMSGMKMDKAKQAGSGRFYLLTRLGALPEVFKREVGLALKR